MRITRDGDQIKIAFPGLDVAKLSDADKARLLAHIEEQKRPVSMSVKPKETSWKTDGKLCLTTTAHVQALLTRRTSHESGGGSPAG